MGNKKQETLIAQPFLLLLIKVFVIVLTLQVVLLLLFMYIKIVQLLTLGFAL